MKHRLYAKQKKYFLDTKIYISSTKYFFGFPKKKFSKKATSPDMYNSVGATSPGTLN
jgi:hypothetical protein